MQAVIRPIGQLYVPSLNRSIVKIYFPCYIQIKSHYNFDTIEVKYNVYKYDFHVPFFTQVSKIALNFENGSGA